MVRNCDQDQKEKKMVVKFVGGGGGIGAVILLGGALATAAFASAFAARRKRRSSGKDRRSLNRNPPPENGRLSEKDEAKNDTVSLDIGMNCVSDDGFVIVDEDFPQSEDKSVSDDSSKEEENQEQEKENIGIIEEDKDADEERESCGDEEMMREKKCVENEERESGLQNQIGEIVEEGEEIWSDEKKLVEKQENGYILHQTKDEITNEEVEFDAMKIVEKEVDVSAEAINEGIEKAKGGTVLETSEEEEEIVEESLLGSEDSSSFESKKNVEKEVDVPAKAINEGIETDLETSEEEEEEEKIVEESSLGSEDSTPYEFKKNVEKEADVPAKAINEDIETDLETSEEEEEEEKIVEESSLGSEDSTSYEFKKNVEKEADVPVKATNVGIETDLETSEEEEEEEEIVEESSLGSEDSSSSESNSEAIWPTESVKSKLVDYNVGERDGQAIIEEKTFIDKYYMGEMGMEKDHRRKYSGRRRVAIATLSLLSSLSCSWFFGLSFTHLCLVVFLTMVMSELHGY